MSMLDFVDCLGSSQGAVASFCVFMPFCLLVALYAACIF